MMRMTKGLTVMVCLALAACGLPRSAGFQTEVLAAKVPANSAEGAEKTRDFAVFAVTKESLPLIAAWPSAGAAALPWPGVGAQPASLLIAPGDTVQVSIWDAEENSLLAGAGQRFTQLQTAEVDSAGQIFIPYIGMLQLAGVSPSQARAQIEEELVRTIPSAQVQLRVEPGRMNAASLAAGVAAPGLYPLPDRGFTLLDLLSQAGGPTADLAEPHVRLVRAGRTYGIAYERLLTEPARNPQLRGGDRIYLIDAGRKFMTLGATGSQAIFEFPEAELSALEALSLIGGVNGGAANPEAVLILREYPAAAVGDGVSGPPQARVVFTIDLTSADGLFSAGRFMLQGDDLIYGTESLLGPALTLVGLGSSVSALATTN